MFLEGLKIGGIGFIHIDLGYCKEKMLFHLQYMTSISFNSSIAESIAD